MLVYGVTYQVTVYNVEGYQPGTATVRAGLQDSVIVNITTSASPLVLVSNTATACKPFGTSTTVSNTAQVVFTFNTSTIEDVTTSVGKGPEVLDNGVTVSTMFGATLKSSASTAVQERGTMFLLNGNTLTIFVSIRWAASSADRERHHHLRDLQQPVGDHAAADRPSRAGEVAGDADRSVVDPVLHVETVVVASGAKHAT